MRIRRFTENDAENVSAMIIQTERITNSKDYSVEFIIRRFEGKEESGKACGWKDPNDDSPSLWGKCSGGLYFLHGKKAQSPCKQKEKKGRDISAIRTGNLVCFGL